MINRTSVANAGALVARWPTLPSPTTSTSNAPSAEACATSSSALT